MLGTSVLPRGREGGEEERDSIAHPRHLLAYREETRERAPRGTISKASDAKLRASIADILPNYWIGDYPETADMTDGGKVFRARERYALSGTPEGC